MTHLSIRNFQSIANLDLKIDGFTVVVGPSDIGKSAIRRAINFPLTNDWDKAYVRNNSKDVEIEIQKDEFSLKRVKGKSNLTVLNGVTFEKSGTTVPTEFKEFGVKQLQTVDNEYNILVSSQLDRLFLTSYSESEQHKVLNAILETAKYEEALRYVNNDINAMAKRARENQEQIELSLAEITRLESIVHALSEISRLQLSMENIRQYIDLQSKHTDLHAREVYMRNADDSIDALVSSLGAVSLLSKKSKVDESVNKFESALEPISRLPELMSFQLATSKSAKVSGQIQKMESLIGSLQLTAVSAYQSHFKTLDAKLYKATKINHSMGVILSMSEQAEFISSWGRVTSKENDNICKQIAIGHTLESTGDQEMVFNILRLYNMMEGINPKAHEVEIALLDKEINQLMEEHKKTCNTCPTCGQALP